LKRRKRRISRCPQNDGGWSIAMALWRGRHGGAHREERRKKVGKMAAAVGGGGRW
jgi:hypothetical protein